jgi:putative glutamine transport system substrate-binding protein
MKTKINLTLAFLLLIGCIKSQNPDSLIINYYENYPYAYNEGTTLKGIEIDIISEYVAWLKQKKNISVVLSYKQYKEFSPFYNSAKTLNSKVLGLGSVTNNAEREKEVLFSPPYLNNLAVLITDGRVPTVKSKSQLDVSGTLGSLNAFVVSNSSHINYLNSIKKLFVPALKISFTETQKNVLDKIAADKNVFGYVDIVAYWSYLKQNPDKFLKIQKAFNEPKEQLGFIMPKNSIHAAYIYEFFEAGFGFTSTKIYRQILEKYLGREIIDAVEIK